MTIKATPKINFVAEACSNIAKHKPDAIHNNQEKPPNIVSITDTALITFSFLLLALSGRSLANISAAFCSVKPLNKTQNIYKLTFFFFFFQKLIFTLFKSVFNSFAKSLISILCSCCLENI